MNVDANLHLRNQELSILNTVARELNRSLDLDEALDTALAHVATLLGLSTAWIWLLDEASGAYYLAARRNLPPALAEHPERMDGQEYCYCLDTYKCGDLSGAANVNVIGCSRLTGLASGVDGLRFHASIPLYAHGKKLGILNVASAEWKKLSPSELDLLHTLGDLLAIAIERARLFDRSAQLGAAEERSRLARELHDTLAQSLAGVALQLESAEALLDAGVEAARVRRALHQALELTRSSLEEARRAVLDLRAAALQGRNLPEALRLLAEQASRDAGHLIDLKIIGARPLPPRVEVGLYRMAQEALANAVRHSAARNIRVRLELHPDQIELRIEDDGQGFDPAQLPSGRYGLVGLSERARLMGGQLRIESAQDSGTRISMRLEGSEW